MSTNKHTPGPWSATRINGSWWFEEDDDPTAFCRRGRRLVVDDGAGIDSPEAYARLIAAAPELLAALEGLVNFVANSGMEFGRVTKVKWLESYEPMNAAREAIRVAKGESK